jgi:Amt family ammonium transporter
MSIARAGQPAAALLLAALLSFCLPVVGFAQDAATAEAPAAEAAAEAPAEEPAAEEEAAAEPIDLGVGYAVDNAVLFFCAVLVFFMQAGFAMVEAGFNASKNAVNIVFKNTMDFCVGAILFFVTGFGLMYPSNYAEPHIIKEGYLAFGGFGLDGYAASDTRRFSPETDWLFQCMFAATAATIVSGAVAGRIKIAGYLIYSAVLSGLVYPISGYWKWGLGWLNTMGFVDFAGSAVVHCVGGFAGLAGAMILGPRLGRFVDGKSIPVPGHNIPLAGLGVFILWMGWYGFNPGSQLAFKETVNIDVTTHCALTTTLAASAGGVVGTFLSWIMFGRPDLGMALNGILGALVGITAGCHCFDAWWAMAVGGIAGVIVIFGTILLEKIQIDDPVGAFPVHGLCGLWGCLAIGILPNTAGVSLATQACGAFAISLWSFVTMFLLFSILRAIGLLRVSPEDEQAGLDVSEHGMAAYTH